jgi:hypothetical protein
MMQAGEGAGPQDPDRRPGRLRVLAGGALPQLAFAGSPVEPAAIAPGRQAGPGRNKPAGGLWLSPVTRDSGGRIAGTAWTRWCERDYPGHPAVRRGARLTVVPLRTAARVAVVSRPGDFAALAAAAGTVTTRRHALAGPVELDWDGVARCADAVWLTFAGLASLGGMGDPFYWWNAETVVVLDPAAVAPLGPVLARSAAARRGRGRAREPVYEPAAARPLPRRRSGTPADGSSRVARQETGHAARKPAQHTPVGAPELEL